MTQFIAKEWLVAEALVCAELVDAVSCFMHEMCSHGVTIQDDVSQSVVTAYFSPEMSDKVRMDLEDYIISLSQNFPEFPRPQISYRTTLSENWAVAWKDNFKVMEVGSKLMVSPPWLSPETKDRHLIIIEPAEAFGTGSHETTQGCLELLEEIMLEREKQALRCSVLDVGCGSGILAIAATKLGADSVTAIDNDPVAIESAVENAELNKVNGKIRFECRAIESGERRFDVVIANLDARTLTSTVGALKETFTDSLVVSGVTVDQWPSLKEQFEAKSLNLLKELIKQEWVSAVFSH
jgi:ribosomal protein L11 methyltransferase